MVEIKCELDGRLIGHFQNYFVENSNSYLFVRLAPKSAVKRRRIAIGTT